ncbi:MAG: Bax inhibitor-1/YccA family protein [Pseudonocardia sp.]
MRGSSNPAFRNLPVGQQGGYATFDRNAGAAGGMAGATDMYASGADYGRTAAGERPLTVDDVVSKTAVVVGVTVVAGVITAVAQAYFLAIPALIVGLVLALIIIFRQSMNPALILGYAVAEGVLLGAITGALEFSGTQFEGIGFQAIIGTFGVFFGMLVVYKTGAVRVTPRFTKWLMGALIGVVVLMLANFVASFFTTGGLGLRDGSPLAYLFSIVVIGVAAFMLLLDFDGADKAVKAGAPAKVAWYIAFGLLVTLVWLYLEILRLLSYLRE